MPNPKLIKQLKEKHPNLNSTEITFILKIILESTTSALKDGKSVELRNFGRFYCKKLKENFNARNPSTNELLYKPERVRLRFKASSKLNKLINEWKNQKYLLLVTQQI